MAYFVKTNDTIYDVAYNVAGSIAGVDSLLEYNTPDNPSMLHYDQLKAGIQVKNGYVQSTDQRLLVDSSDNACIVMYFELLSNEDGIIFNSGQTEVNNIEVHIDDERLIIYVGSTLLYTGSATLGNYFIAININNRGDGALMPYASTYINGVRSNNTYINAVSSNWFGFGSESKDDANIIVTLASFYNCCLAKEELDILYNNDNPLYINPIENYESVFSRPMIFAGSNGIGNGLVEDYPTDLLTPSESYIIRAEYERPSGGAVYLAYGEGGSDVIPLNTVFTPRSNVERLYIRGGNSEDLFYFNFDISIFKPVAFVKQYSRYGLIARFTPQNIKELNWQDSYNNIQLDIYGQSTAITSDDVPVSNYMETYTPTLQEGLLLNTDNVPLQNLEATQQLPFNSTIGDYKEVYTEIRTMTLQLNNAVEPNKI